MQAGSVNLKALGICQRLKELGERTDDILKRPQFVTSRFQYTTDNGMSRKRRQRRGVYMHKALIWGRLSAEIFRRRSLEKGDGSKYLQLFFRR